MVERQYEALRRDKLRGAEENRSDGPPSSESTPNSTPIPTPAPTNDETPSDNVNIIHIIIILIYYQYNNNLLSMLCRFLIMMQ